MMPLIREGKIRPLAYTGLKRSPDPPDVPTMIESGYPQVGFNPDVWVGIFAPAGTHAAIIDRLNREVNDVLISAEMAPTLKQFGYEAKADDGDLQPREPLLPLAIVNASSSACVGCSCMPSPAFTIAERQIRESM